MAPTRSIILVGNPLLDEIVAGATISPGMLLRKQSTGVVNPAATEGGREERMIALEDALQGKTVDDNYAAADIVSIGRFKRGEKFQGLLKAGVGVVVGEQLISAGDGTFIGVADATSAGVVVDVIAVADEALDLSASGSVNTLIQMRIM